MKKFDSSQVFNESQTKIGIIGAGIVGATTALFLNELGYDVVIIDSSINKNSEIVDTRNGSSASLGVLMGYVYLKESGRSWRLRKRSMELWPEIIKKLNSKFNTYEEIDKPLIKLATTEKEKSIIDKLVTNKNKYKIESIKNKKLLEIENFFQTKLLGGLISHNDGRINPKRILNLILNFLKESKVKIVKDEVLKLNKNKSKWKISLKKNDEINCDIVIICASLGSLKLIKDLEQSIIMEPIIGQAVDIKYKNNNFFNANPGVYTFNNLNFIPHQPDRVLVGASVEKSITPNKNEVEKIKDIIKKILGKNNILDIIEWNGIRARPTNQASPILKNLDNGLFVNTGHYRNGIMNAPACAEWICDEIEKTI